ncbi:hypothetical protein IKG33_01675 [Candidatus Saccharibacteria bacterium]|nr:hypothetical protein [Candidatus Saccharibacteria bacterium]
MTNIPFLSPNTIACIARGSVSLEQNYYYHSHGWGNRYCVRVAYPNGYGASIVFSPEWDDEECWEVGLLKDGKLWSDDERYDCVWSGLDEVGVIAICDKIYFM